MNIGNVNTKLTTESGADTNTYTSAERVIDINNAALKLQSIILDCQDEADFDDLNHGDYPILTVPLVAGQRDYAIPASEYVISIKKLSVTYDGSTYYEATPIDSGEVSGVLQAPSGSTMETTIDGYYSKTAPRYDWKYGSLFIYPRADATDVANSAKAIIEWNREAYQISTGELSTGTLVPSFDGAFHSYLFLEPAFNWCSAKGKNDRLPSLKARIDAIEAMVRKQYGRKQKDRRLAFQAMYKNYK